MITTHEFRTDEKLREIFPDYSNAFPCFCKYNRFQDMKINPISWHWHQDFEIDYIVSGSVCFQTAGPDIMLKKGEAVFINSNMLHSFKEGDPDDCGGERAEYYTFFFSADFLSGGFGTLFYEKYVLPILACQTLQAWPVRPDCPEGVRILNRLLDIIDLFRDEPYGYEFELRSQISRTWLALLEITQQARAVSGRANMSDNARMKQMISYIEDHYSEKITLDDIAASAGIGGRECGRCFDRTVGQSPVRYLTGYRVRQAARRIAETADPIGDIASECGFSSDSYFGKIFRENMGCSPNEYRKKRPAS